MHVHDWKFNNLNLCAFFQIVIRLQDWRKIKKNYIISCLVLIPQEIANEWNNLLEKKSIWLRN